MLTETDYSKIRKELEESQNPLFFFHDDADGLASFLLLYRYIKEGKGVCVKSSPRVDMKFFRKVEEHNPDKIFVVDLAMMDQEFIDSCKVPIIWIDHHAPQDNTGVKYFNPRVKTLDLNLPASYLCYQVVKQDLWIAMIGVIGDWHYPDFAEEFKKTYPGYIGDSTEPDDVLFDTKLGELIKMISFLLKGKTSDVNKCIKILSRINSLDEFKDANSPPIKFLLKRYDLIKKNYDSVLSSALKQIGDDELFVFNYHSDTVSLTKELSNEIQHNAKDKTILICREKSGEMKCSLRSQKHLLPPILEKCLLGLEGYGGGHEHACGTVVKKEDFPEFITRLREEL